MGKAVLAGTAWGVAAAVAVFALCVYGRLASMGQSPDFTFGILIVAMVLMATPAALVVSALVFNRLILRHRLGISRSHLRWTGTLLGSILAYLCLPVTFALQGDEEALIGLLHPGSCWPHVLAALLGGAALGFSVASRVAALPRAEPS